MDLEKKEFEINYQGRPLKLEISRLAEQANAAVLGRYGDTVVLVTTVMTNSDRPDVDYFPLVVDYEEKFYAAGKIIGSRFIRREGRPSEEATLSARLIDRAIRPLFDQKIRRGVQVVVTILSIDEENDPDFIALISASTALSISNIPWAGPIAGLNIAKINGDFVINPPNGQKEKTEFSLFAAGQEGEINMIEAAANESKEEDLVKALEIAQKEIKVLIDFQKEIVKAVGTPKAQILIPEPNSKLLKAIDEFLKDKLEKAVYPHHQNFGVGVYEKDKIARVSAVENLREELKTNLAKQGFDEENIEKADGIYEEKINVLIHKNILEKEKRPDGRGLDEIRELHAEVGLFKRTHGSGLFIRGTTQALSVTTLAAPGAEQLIETMETSTKRGFMHHYNFPPYCVGEIGTFRGPGRREIGHGALAGKSLRPLIPSQDEFPYTIRVVSEILSSNGSSSMASVCAASLSLMDAGVPIKRPAAGIAMGLIMKQQPATGNQQPVYKILTDIQGPEDRHGDMDLKVAGTEKGITAIQMDVKIEGLAPSVLKEVLEQAKKARLLILDKMKEVLPAPRSQISPYAPKVLVTNIDPVKIREVIGPGGRVINEIINQTGAAIEIEQTGKIFISADTNEKAKAALAIIENITKEFQVGELVEGRVSKILDFGAIVDLAPGRDGMIHISELANRRIEKIEEVVKIGDKIKAKIIRIDPDGHIGLSLKNQNRDK
mgnify:CR=1 FL=1